MAESESSEAIQLQHDKGERQLEEPNDKFEEEDDDDEDEDDDDYEEGGEEEEEGGQLTGELRRLAESQLVKLPVDQPETKEPQLRTLSEKVPSAAALSENDQCVETKVNSVLVTQLEVESKEQSNSSHQEVLGNATVHCAEPQTHKHLKSSASQLSPTSVTQSISSAASPTPPKQRLSSSKAITHVPEADQLGSSDFKSKTLVVPSVKAPIRDGYNWRKYGQKQVKSPTGSRSYYKCTYSDCRAKKIECSDHSGQVIEIVNKGEHSHDPPQKNSGARQSKVTLTAGSASVSVTEHPIRTLKDSDPVTLLHVPGLEMATTSDRKRQNSTDSDGNGEIQVKEEQFNEPEPKRRLKKSNLECSGTILKPGKKPKFVVHAAGDVGISGDGYRWRKYGQKMVKGNSYPRNYYRCTSAGCPVRKHIETAVDNANAVVITYKGVHDHDMPVPKKRHGPPSAPLVAAAAPASMNNLQAKKPDALQNQVASTQWSVGKEGELNAETLDHGGEKEKAIESARTLLSIGFEIKPC